MNNSEYKHYTTQAKVGVKGEAFFESLVSDYCIPHHIVGAKDIGLDYICEWVHGDRPTGVLFAVQIKTRSEKSATLEFIEIDEQNNGLCKYKIHSSNLIIDNRTLHYWQGLGMPTYLFAIIQGRNNDGTEKLDCFYKRFTPVLTREDAPQAKQGFYKVNEGGSFIAFRDPEGRTRGFTRDLFMDHVRCCYHRGSITGLNPRDLGLGQFPEEVVFKGLVKEYSRKILSTYHTMTQYLQALGYIRKEA